MALEGALVDKINTGFIDCVVWFGIDGWLISKHGFEFLVIKLCVCGLCSDYAVVHGILLLLSLSLLVV